LHEQDNDKVLRADNQQDKTIAKEKGLDSYKKVEDSKCAFAQQWWAANQNFWAEVRKEWAEVYAKNKNLQLEKTVNKMPLFMHLFPLKPEQTAEIKPVIQQFVKK
jgi:thioredoxin-like negative regulator of GroEL